MDEFQYKLMEAIIDSEEELTPEQAEVFCKELKPIVRFTAGGYTFMEGHAVSETAKKLYTKLVEDNIPYGVFSPIAHFRAIMREAIDLCKKESCG